MKEEFIEFVEKEMNKNNQHNNVTVYCGECFPCYETIEISFKRNHMANYKKVISKVVEMGGVVKNTDLLTFRTTVAFFK